ncbi:hypothetical protein [Bradyrhizobium sp.]|jgi:hypothetical protein|uniref:hypothetical protein n=1 Tax=Bradyrhizobium sp. TaxID=376 RepID=UPI002E031640|nr:hypothetical protein [Bradyrhizobium sp.]
MGLFDVEVTDSSLGWENIKAAKSSTETWMKAELEKLWTYYEPKADEGVSRRVRATARYKILGNVPRHTLGAQPISPCIIVTPRI